MARTAPPESWGKSTVRTDCPLDCPDACTLDVTVENGRVQKIDGGDDNPVTRNFICAKVRRFDERVYGEDRVLYPSVRQGTKGGGTSSSPTPSSTNTALESELNSYNWAAYLNPDNLMAFKTEYSVEATQDFYASNEEMIAKRRQPPRGAAEEDQDRGGEGHHQDAREQTINVELGVQHAGGGTRQHT